ncbi:glycosyltransferase family 9 protein [Paraburkholderia sp. PREW-6R]|uniref:glycosyltransferase family 9 protein n=1 Tax=Paraburkholderia sp. PREW-6R TaxID=3141544 RepID=UPI0031F5BB88
MSDFILTTPAARAAASSSTAPPGRGAVTPPADSIHRLWSILRDEGIEAAVQCAAALAAAGETSQLHADLCASAGRFEAAYHSASQADASANGARHARLALFADALGHTDAAARHSELAVSMQSHAASLEWIVWLSNRCGAHSAAVHMLRAYERQVPNDARAPWWLAISLAAARAAPGLTQGRTPAQAQTERRAALMRAYALDPSVDAALPLQLALALREIRDWRAVERLCREALARDPADAEMAWQLSHAQWQCNDAAAAEATMRAVDTLAPGNAQVMAAIGMYLGEQGRYAQSEAVLHAALAIDPSATQAAVDLADLELRRGAWALAWPRFEARLARDDREQNNVVSVMARVGPRWRGEPLAGKTLVVHSEQGCGDDIHMVRFVPQLAARVRAEGGRLVLAVRRALQPLFVSFYADCVAIEATSLAFADFVLPMMSMPLVLGLLPEQVRGGAYLQADALLVGKWRERVRASAPNARLSVGLVWCGSPTHRRDAKRSIPLAALEPLFRLPDVAFHPLTPGRGADVAALVARGHRICDLTAQYDAGFADVAAHLAALDALVTIDSAPLHLGGALGRPVFALLDHVSHWSWGNAEAQPWYDSVRLFRQPEPGTWTPVVQRVVTKLKELEATGGTA